MDKSQAIYSFWSSFGLSAYDENSVPDDAVMPYITYSDITDSIDYVALLTGSLWYRSDSWKDISKKRDEISQYIGLGGVSIQLDRGYLWITRGTPFAQRMADESDASVRRIYFNLNGEFLTDI